MNLIKITDLTSQLGLSSRTLRYYEQVGLIESIRQPFEAYRYYDEQAIERIRQIMVLRKMQIPIKDIVRIFESPEMSTIVDVFVKKMDEIDGEVTALSELKNIIQTFLQKMIHNGIKKISALPLLYEEMEKQFELMEGQNTVTFSDLDKIHERFSKPIEPAIISLPVMRVLSSCLKENLAKSDIAGFWRLLQSGNVFHWEPGQHELFEYQMNGEECAIVRVPDDFVNDSRYVDFIFEGGLYAVVNVYVDEDLEERFRSLVKSFDENRFYQVDYTHTGELRHPAMLENLISPDEKREMAALLVPVKKRIANPVLFEKPQELLSDSITIAEIEVQNLALWEVDVPLTSITTINGPHYRILDNGEAEYTGWISTRVLDTNVSVKLPFRVDIEFRLAGNDEKFGYGAKEGCIIVYHGEEAGYFSGGSLGQVGFGINMGRRAVSNEEIGEEAISFCQPVFGDLYRFPGRGKIDYTGYNHVTWIIGAKHLAVIINGEIRYCGTNFPYMSLDLNREKVKNIIIGSDGQGMKYIKSIRISQLAYEPKNKFKKEGLTMITRQSNNMIPNIHRLVTDEKGENYWFNGCASYVMECLGEKDYDYEFFAGLTGDVFVQCYPNGEYRGEGVSAYMLGEGPKRCLKEGDTRYELCDGEPGFVEQLFERCGYTSTFVTEKELSKNTGMYVQTLMSYIDRGIPVILFSFTLDGPPDGVFVGYEEYGKVLLLITGNSSEPVRIPVEKVIRSESLNETCGWIFVGDKRKERPLAEIYRETIIALPKLLSTETDKFYFGANAFRAWADEIESGKFNSMKPEEFDQWAHYTSYVCCLATNGSCCHGFLERAKRLNPDMTFLCEVSSLYQQCGRMWNRDNGKDLEALGGGFNCTLEVLKDKVRRDKIVAKIREFADVNDRIVMVLNEGIKTL